MPAPVSIVIANYNHAALLPVAIDSALGQTYPNVEVIVVDDGSTDASPDVLQRYEGRVRCLRQTNRGVVAARNAGCRAATGEFINFLDSDDYLMPTKIAQQMQLFKAQPEVGLVHCGFYEVDHDGRYLNRVTTFPAQHILRELAVDCFLVVHAPLVQRRWLDQAGLFDERLPWDGQHAEDWELWLRLAKAGCPFAFVAEPLAAYRVLPTSRMMDVPRMERGIIGVLDRLYAANDLPADVLAVKPEAYGLHRLWISFGYFETEQWAKARASLAEAWHAYPAFARDPALPLQKIVDAAMAARVRDPLGFVEAVLTHLPSEAAGLEGHRPEVRSRVRLSLAMRHYAAGDQGAGRRWLGDALAKDPALVDAADMFDTTLCHFAMNSALPDPVALAMAVFQDVPPAARSWHRLRRHVLSKLHVACAFRDFDARHWGSTLRHVVAAGRHRPGVFGNRGVLSILARSLLALPRASRTA